MSDFFCNTGKPRKRCKHYAGLHPSLHRTSLQIGTPQAILPSNSAGNTSVTISQCCLGDDDSGMTSTALLRSRLLGMVISEDGQDGKAPPGSHLPDRGGSEDGRDGQRPTCLPWASLSPARMVRLRQGLTFLTWASLRMANMARREVSRMRMAPLLVPSARQAPSRL